VCGTMLCEEMGKSAPGGRFELTARSWQDC
jgi:hypothetical protein